MKAWMPREQAFVWFATVVGVSAGSTKTSRALPRSDDRLGTGKERRAGRAHYTSAKLTAGCALCREAPPSKSCHFLRRRLFVFLGEAPRAATVF